MVKLVWCAVIIGLVVVLLGILSLLAAVAVSIGYTYLACRLHGSASLDVEFRLVLHSCLTDHVAHIV